MEQNILLQSYLLIFIPRKQSERERERERDRTTAASNYQPNKNTQNIMLP